MLTPSDGQALLAMVLAGLGGICLGLAAVYWLSR